MIKGKKPIFDKYGSNYHLRISTINDLEYILDLPDGRWAATSCPVFGLNVDSDFLKFLDTGGNGRIISDDIRNAIRWLFKCLKPSETWMNHQPNLPIELINNVDDPEGKILKDVAELVLGNLNVSDAQEITLSQVRNRQKIMAQADYNGDGVIPPEVVDDSESKKFVQDLMASIGNIPDISGLKGVNEGILDQFKKEANVYIEWYDKGIIPEGQNETPVMPFSSETPGMFKIISSIRDKVDQFFAQCTLIRLEPRTSNLMKSRDDELAKLDYRDRWVILEYLQNAPLAEPNPDGILPLDNSVNEFYHNSINSLRENIITKMFGEEITFITESQWRQVIAKFEPYEVWLKSKPNVTIESLGIDKLRAYLNPNYDMNIRTLIINDKAVADEIKQLQNLEKLILYHQWLFEFVNNYVSLPYLFDVDTHAIFEMGRLILGGREFTFSIQVENRAVHSVLAKNSGIYLLYLQITGVMPEEKFEIAIAVTRGSAKDFYVGKRGVFFTMSGKEMDAQIVQIVENPISLWDSIKEPFRVVYGMIGSRFSQIATTIQKEAEKGISTSASDQQAIQTQFRDVQVSSQSVPVTTPTPAAIPATPVVKQDGARSSSNTRDLMIGTGLLVAGLGTALKFVVDAAKQLTQPNTLKVLLIMIGIFIIISVSTTTFTAWRRLRQRDLGVLLQASGWSINRRIRLIRPMARIFCRNTRIPKGASKHRKELLKPLERLVSKREKSGIKISKKIS